MKHIADLDKKIAESFDAEIASIKSCAEQAEMGPEKAKEYEDAFMAAHEETQRLEREFKALIISGYDGGYKFSQELLSIVYHSTYSFLNEHCSSRLEMPKRFEDAMVSYEMAFSEGVKSVVDKM